MVTPSPSPTSPVGVFDSGVGGLSVLKALHRALPQEHFIYVADSAHAPYGSRSTHYIEQRACAIVDFLVSAHAKAIVVACNTATVVAVEKLRTTYPLPIVAMEPAIKPAVQLSRSGVVGVLATERTLESPSLARLCQLHGQSARLILQPCPGLVEQVERGHAGMEHTRVLLKDYIAPLMAAGADTIVLGCTHYVFLESEIRRIVGPDVAIVESSTAVARQLERRLAGQLNTQPFPERGTMTFFTTGRIEMARDIFTQLWGAPIGVRHISEAMTPAAQHEAGVLVSDAPMGTP